MQTLKIPIKKLLKEKSFIDKNGCWIWIGSYASDGYPKFSGHRINRLILNLKAKDGYLGCHKCNNPKCVNPKHLYKGTPLTNTRDSQKAGTFQNLHNARDEQWRKQTKEERSKRVANGVRGIKKFIESLTKEQKSFIGKRAANARWRNS